MTNDSAQRPIAALNELLENERTALLGGDLEKVTTLLPTKEDLIGQMTDVCPSDPALLQALSLKVARNQALLTGAMEGIRTVNDRLSALRRVRDGLETYGADGKRRAIATHESPSVERRA
ncbi:MAG: flagellar biosynthesis protein FlgN [Sulfitobacter sp.]|nr:flagellar biosynthesis protein FlgN [Sulfitobacter sp.]